MKIEIKPLKTLSMMTITQILTRIGKKIQSMKLLSILIFLIACESKPGDPEPGPDSAMSFQLALDIMRQTNDFLGATAAYILPDLIISQCFS